MEEGREKGKGVKRGREEEKDSRRQGRDGKGGTRKCKVTEVEGRIVVPSWHPWAPKSTDV